MNNLIFLIIYLWICVCKGVSWSCLMSSHTILCTFACYCLLNSLSCACSNFSMFPKSTHETFSTKLYATFKANKRFIKPKLSRTDFIISHYAGEVCIRHLLLYLLGSANWRCLLNYMASCCLLVLGPISIWSIFGQKQRLCCCRTSRFVECFQMLFCSWPFPTTSWRDNQVII